MPLGACTHHVIATQCLQVLTQGPLLLLFRCAAGARSAPRHENGMYPSVVFCFQPFIHVPAAKVLTK